jgi:hypothetical protein
MQADRKLTILSCMPKLRSLSELLLTIFHLLLDSLRLIGASLQPRCRLAAENLFLRKQLALYLERQVKPRRAKAAAPLDPGIAFQAICLARGSDRR